jgi:hypothetical protein
MSVYPFELNDSLCNQRRLCPPLRAPAQFNLAIDSKLRGCDVVAVKVEDVAPNGYTMDAPLCARRGRATSQVRAD